MPPPNSCGEQSLEVGVDHLEGGEQPLARFAVEVLDALAQPLDRFDQIVALGGQRGVLGLDLAQFFFGAQIDGAEPFAVAAQPLEIRLRPRRPRGSAVLGLDARRGRRPRAGSTSSISWISWAISASRRLAPSKRSSARAASSRAVPMRFERGARGAVGVGRARSRPSARRSAAARRAVSAVSISLISARRFSSNTRGASSSSARSLLASATAGVEGRDLRGRAVVAVAPGLPLGGDRLRAGGRRVSASRASACASARTSASCARWPSISARTPASWRLDVGAGGSAASAARPRRAQRPPRRGRRQAAPWPRSAPRGARCCALISRSASAVEFARRVGLALRARASASRAAASALRRRISFGLGCRRATVLLRVDVARAGIELALDVGEAVALPARRRAAPVGAWAATDEAVPAPQVAFARNQPLAGLEQRARAAPPRRARPRRSAPGGAPAPGGALTCSASASTPSGSAGSVGSTRRPSSASARTDRLGASRSSPSAAPSADLVALVDGEVVDHRRPQVLGVDRAEASPASWLRCRAAAPARSASASGPRAASSVWRAAACAASARKRGGFGLADRAPAAASARRRARQVGEVCAALDHARAPASTLAISLSRRATRSPCSRAACSSWLAPRGEVGERAGQFAEGLLRCREHGVGFGDALASTPRALCARAALDLALQRVFFARQPRQRGLGVRDQALARARCRRRTEPAGGRARPCGPWRASPRASSVSRATSQALQAGGGRGLGLAQRRQLGGRVSPGACAASACSPVRSATIAHRRILGVLGLGDLGIGARASAGETAWLRPCAPLADDLR